MSGTHGHWFHALWSHLGPYGPQDIHYHPCVEGERGDCYWVLVGPGRDCDGKKETHQRDELPLDDAKYAPPPPPPRALGVAEQIACQRLEALGLAAVSASAAVDVVSALRSAGWLKEAGHRAECRFEYCTAPAGECENPEC